MSTTCDTSAIVSAAAVAITGPKLRAVLRYRRGFPPGRRRARRSGRRRRESGTPARSRDRRWCAVSLPSASGVPTPVGQKNAPMPAPAARMRSARLPCGTTSSSTLPARYSPSNTYESVWRGNEQITLRTRPAASSAASPVSPLPALLLTIVRSVAPWSISASISVDGHARHAESADQNRCTVSDSGDRFGGRTADCGAAHRWPSPAS